MPELSAGAPSPGVEVAQGGPGLGLDAAGHGGPSLADQLGGAHHGQVGLNLDGAQGGAPLGRAVGGSDFGQPGVAQQGLGMGGPQHGLSNSLTQERGPGKGVSPDAAPAVSGPQQAVASQPQGIGEKLSSAGGNLLDWVKDNPGKTAMMAAAAYMLFNPPWQMKLANFMGGGMPKMALVAGLAFGATKLIGAMRSGGSAAAPTGAGPAPGGGQPTTKG